MSKKNPWIEWTTGPCPVAPNTFIDIKARLGGKEKNVPTLVIPARRWNGLQYSDDIIAYRVSSPKRNWKAEHKLLRDAIEFTLKYTSVAAAEEELKKALKETS